MLKPTEAIAHGVLSELRARTAELIEAGLADEYSFPVLRRGRDHVTVEPDVSVDASVLKAKSYAELYEAQLRNRAFNARLPDGGLLQLSYRFQDGALSTHRLAFLPSPFLQSYQEEQEIYIRSEPFAEVVGHQLMAVPIRFDFDAREGVASPDNHPVSHVTLGQYRHCRIPVSGGVTPSAFIEFVLRHFYSTPDSPAMHFPGSKLSAFTDTILPSEQRGSHIQIRRPMP